MSDPGAMHIGEQDDVTVEGSGPRDVSALAVIVYSFFQLGAIGVCGRELGRSKHTPDRT
jgi:hypothetical protein